MGDPTANCRHQTSVESKGPPTACEAVLKQHSHLGVSVFEGSFLTSLNLKGTTEREPLFFGVQNLDTLVCAWGFLWFPFQPSKGSRMPETVARLLPAGPPPSVAGAGNRELTSLESSRVRMTRLEV